MKNIFGKPPHQIGGDHLETPTTTPEMPTLPSAKIIGKMVAWDDCVECETVQKTYHTIESLTDEERAISYICYVGGHSWDTWKCPNCGHLNRTLLLDTPPETPTDTQGEPIC